jgi:hypothetical protein
MIRIRDSRLASVELNIGRNECSEDRKDRSLDFHNEKNVIGSKGFKAHWNHFESRRALLNCDPVFVVA